MKDVSILNFSKWLLDKRLEANLSRKAIADQILVHETSIGRWERGEQLPPLDVANDLVNCFGAKLLLEDE